MKVMDEQPENAVDVIEDISRDVKRSMYVDKQSTLQDVPETTPAELLAEKQRQLFSATQDAEEDEDLVLAEQEPLWILLCVN